MDFQIIKISDSGSGSVGFEWEFTFSSPISTYNERWYREGIIIVNDLEIEKRLKATGLEERHGTPGSPVGHILVVDWDNDLVLQAKQNKTKPSFCMII